MDIAEGYRWNVPFITYAYDQSFLDFFGTQGVAAVESAIKVFNDLPAASAIVLTNYPIESLHLNYEAQAADLVDLKSAALYLLVQHLGLNAPVQSVFVVRQWDPFLTDYDSEWSWPEGTIPTYILERNFDPESLLPSAYINWDPYSGYYVQEGGTASIFLFQVDPTASSSGAVADGFYQDENPYGRFATGLTYDDVGGLRFLLCQTNVNYETLLDDVQLDTCGAGPLVTGAWRPGIEKITFVSQPYDSATGIATPMTFHYTDTFFSNGALSSQCVKRVVTRPDIVFSAGDAGQVYGWVSFFQRTGTTNWINNSTLNGKLNGAGPGVIRPPVKLTFEKLGPLLLSGEPALMTTTSLLPNAWASFDETTNTPIQYPMNYRAGTNGMTVHLGLYSSPFNTAIWLAARTLQIPATAGGTVAFQSSTNLFDWATLATLTNNRAIIEWQHSGIVPMRFFRAVAQ